MKRKIKVNQHLGTSIEDVYSSFVISKTSLGISEKTVHNYKYHLRTISRYNYVSGREKSGKYKLLFKGESVAVIKLSPALYQRAKESPIAYYLEDGCCIRVIQAVRSVLEQEAILAEYKRTGYVGNHPELYPTREKATAILNWLTAATDNK